MYRTKSLPAAIKPLLPQVDSEGKVGQNTWLIFEKRG